MPPQQQQQQQGNTDNAMAPIWTMALLIVVLAVVWSWQHEWIVRCIFYLDVLQAKCVLSVIESPELENLVYILQTVDPSQVQWQDLVDMTAGVGAYTRYPVMLLFAGFSVWLYWSDVPLRFHKTYTMHTLSRQEQVNWPAIMPVVKEENLSKTPIGIGPWAMAALPLEFSRQHDLLRRDDVVLDKAAPGLEMTAGIRRGDAKRIFTLQLGPYWEGFSRCPPHAWALAAAFMARMHRDRDAAKLILDTLNQTFSKNKIQYNIARATLRKYQNMPMVQEICQMHGYMLTILASLLEEARKDGVFPSAEFLWLKIVDRRMWYMLNCVGRQTPFTEVGGPFAHWLAEKAMKRASRVPMVDEAIKGLELAVKQIKLTPKQMQELRP